MFNKKLSNASQEIIDSLIAWRVWLTLGYVDIQIQYRRSVLGPFWITISMGVMIYTMGFLYGNLFKMDMYTYFPFLATGFLTWNLISVMIIESTNSFVEASGFIKQERRPYPIYAFRIVVRNSIIFLHNLLAILPILIFTNKQFGMTHLLLLLLGIIIIILCSMSFGLVLGMLGARFRDLHQIINSIVTLIFFITPIIWQPSMLPTHRAWLAHFNPLTHIISLIRDPLSGNITKIISLQISVSICVFGIVLAFLCLARMRHRIAFWV